MNLRQLTTDLAVVDSALAELDERRTAIVHRISRLTSHRNGQPGILQFPNVPTVEPYAGGCHVWSSEPNSIRPKLTALPRTGNRKPTSVKLRKKPSNRNPGTDRN
jgi:hypothetical protein